jgi:hypothetical protein
MNRVLLLGLVVLATACGGNKTFESLCDNQVPPPAACNIACDPSSAAGNAACPAGYHCSPDGKCDAFCTPSGGQCGDGYSCTEDGRCVAGGNGCVGLACNITDCQAQGKPTTKITGTVFAPNGTLPLYGVSVYVPNKDPGPFAAGVQCGSCADGLPGEPVAQALTDDKGNFVLENVPDGANIPLVITIGKWRRQITVASVGACATQAVAAADTRLPASHDDLTPNTTSVDMPQIAISTGSADSLECLVRRLGVADKEITTDTGTGKIHLFSDTKADMPAQNEHGVGVSKFDAGFAGGSGNFNDSQTLWGNAADAGKLNNYDIVILSCEGAQHAETKSQEAMDHLKAYADVGGRVFLSHWHNVWLEGSTQHTDVSKAKPAVWPGIATFGGSNDISKDGPINDIIDQTDNPKGMSFAGWMLNVQSKPTPSGQVQIAQGTGKRTAMTLDDTKAERWVYFQDGQTQYPQNFQVTTPNEAAEADRCGKVVFSDMHVSGGPDLSKGYPSSCGTADITDQEKALAFMFFDISSCVGVLF